MALTRLSTGLFKTDSASVDFNLDSGAFFVDVSTNNVGIGTSSPAKKLSVKSDGGGSQLGIDIHNQGTATGDDSVISFETQGSREFTIGLDRSATSFVIAEAGDLNSNQRLVIDDSGNVGIKQSSPSSPNGSTDFLHIGNSASTYSSIVLEDNNNAWEIFQNNQLSFRDGTDTRLLIDTSGNVGIGVTSPLGKVNLNSNGAPATSGNMSTGLTVSNGTSGTAINMGTYDAGGYGYIQSAYVNNASVTRDIKFFTGASDRFTIRGGDGVLFSLPTYNATVSSARDVQVQSGDGKLGYVSSIRASKTNIENLNDVSWLYNLSPVKFQFRVREETTDEETGNINISYTEDAESEIQYGLIAEDVEIVNSDLVFYDNVDGTPELRGVQYSRLITPLLKAIQELEARITALEGN